MPKVMDFGTTKPVWFIFTRYHNGDKLDPKDFKDKERKKFSRNGQMLTLFHLNLRDGGKYVCYVSNGNVTINRTMSVAPTRELFISVRFLSSWMKNPMILKECQL